MLTLQHATQVAVHTFVSEASELGFPPGRYAQRIKTTMGNGCDFVFQRFVGDEAHYQQDLGCLRLLVIND